MPPGLNAGRKHEHSDDRRDVAMEHRDQRRAAPWVRAAERPAEAGGRRTSPADVGAREEEDKSRDRGSEHEPRPGRRALASESRPPDDHGEHRQVGEEQLRVRQMHGHPLRRKLEDHGDAAEHGLQRIEDRRDQREREDSAIGAVGHDRPRDHRGDGQPRDDREEAVGPLDARGWVERRQKLSMAKRPIGTSQTRAGDADDAAPHHDEERRDEARVDERAIARGETHLMRLVRARSDSFATSEVDERCRGGEAQAAGCRAEREN